MRKLVIAAKAQPKTEDRGEPVPLEMDDGRVVNWYRPDSAELVLALSAAEAAAGRNGDVKSGRDAVDMGVSFINFIRSMLDDDDWHYLHRRIRTPTDPMRLDDILAVVVDMMREEWTDRPTAPSSPSSTPQGRTGKRSTGTSKPTA